MSTRSRTRRLYRCRAFEPGGYCRHTRLFAQAPAAGRFVRYWHGRGYRVTVDVVDDVEWLPVVDLPAEVSA